MVSPEDREKWVDQVRRSPRRLSAVRGTGLLDTEAEETFDSLSRLAATLLGAPVSFFSVVDEHRDFYKSQIGFPAPLALSRELGGRTFCHYALTSEEPLVIEDALADEIWRAVPTVVTLGVRAYLGVPMFLDGEQIGSFCVVDVQPHAWTPREIEILTQVSKSAEREIALRVALKQATVALARANALAMAQEQLLAVVAHDLRTPLQIINISTALMKAVDDPGASTHIQRISTAADLMKRLVDDLLATQAIKHYETQRTMVSAARLLADAVGTMEAVSLRAGIQLSVKAAAGTVFVDAGQLLRVFANLIGNCIKYCPVGSTVSFEAIDLDDSVEFVVSDDGPGMSEIDQARAFDRGWRGTKDMAQHEGAGLGLSIVRELVLQNDGVVSVKSEQGCGTTVLIRLPRQ